MQLEAIVFNITLLNEPLLLAQLLSDFLDLVVFEVHFAMELQYELVLFVSLFIESVYLVLEFIKTVDHDFLVEPFEVVLVAVVLVLPRVLTLLLLLVVGLTEYLDEGGLGLPAVESLQLGLLQLLLALSDHLLH